MHAFGQSSHATKHDDPESLVSQFYDLAQKGTKPDSSLVSSLNTSLEKKGSSFGPQEIANLLWSVAKTGTKLDPKILATVFGLISAKAGSFKPAQIAAVLWALGTIGGKVDSGGPCICTRNSRINSKLNSRLSQYRCSAFLSTACQSKAAKVLMITARAFFCHSFDTALIA